MIETSLAPGLLLAMPQLADPNFSRAVVLMIEHNDEGSFGLIINRPLELAAFELLETMSLEWLGDQDELVWSGGPVMQSSGWILHTPVDALPATGNAITSDVTMLVCPEVALSCSPDALRTIAEDPPDKVRLILGYSGWGPGQLATEMARGAWLHADASADLIFDAPPDQMWERALRSNGIDPQAIVHGSGVH